MITLDHWQLLLAQLVFINILLAVPANHSSDPTSAYQ